MQPVALLSIEKQTAVYIEKILGKLKKTFIIKDKLLIQNKTEYLLKAKCFAASYTNRITFQNYPSAHLSISL